MNGRVITFDPGQIDTIVDGGVVTGYGESDMISFSFDEDNNSKHADVKGHVDRAVSAVRSGILELTIKGTSPWINQFIKLANSNALFPVSVEDRNENGTSISGIDCWVVKAPDIAKGKEIEEQTVQIQIPRAILK